MFINITIDRISKTIDIGPEDDMLLVTLNVNRDKREVTNFGAAPLEMKRFKLVERKLKK